MLNSSSRRDSDRQREKRGRCDLEYDRSVWRPRPRLFCSIRKEEVGSAPILLGARGLRPENVGDGCTECVPRCWRVLQVLLGRADSQSLDGVWQSWCSPSTLALQRTGGNARVVTTDDRTPTMKTFSSNTTCLDIDHLHDYLDTLKQFHRAEDAKTKDGQQKSPGLSRRW